MLPVFMVSDHLLLAERSAREAHEHAMASQRTAADIAYVIDQAEGAFLDVVRRFNGLPELERLASVSDLVGNWIEFRADFSNDYHVAWRVACQRWHNLPRGFCNRYEDDCRQLYERLRQQHAYPLLGVDPGREEVMTVNLRPGAVNYVPWDGDVVSSVDVAHLTATQARRLADEHALRMRQTMANVYGVPSAASHAKSKKLLREWLSPGQLVEYDRDESFTVVGSDTGRTYRIRPDNSYNIDRLNGAGKVKQTYCVVPDGAPALGDIMLAQKVMLETSEKAALKKANKRGGGINWFAGAMPIVRPGTRVVDFVLTPW